jgi:hypothetical protein
LHAEGSPGASFCRGAREAAYRRSFVVLLALLRGVAPFCACAPNQQWARTDPSGEEEPHDTNIFSDFRSDAGRHRDVLWRSPGRRIG